MIIWVNGAFGSGKTLTSYELHRRIPNSYVFDPEYAGFYIRKNLPKEMVKGDFQNYTMWREINYAMLKYIASGYDGIIIVPMTVVDPVIFNEIVGQLRNDGIAIHHFTLWASREVLLKRLRSRGEGQQSWAAGQIDRCMAGLSNDVFQQRIATDDKSIDEVVEAIASNLDFPLLQDGRGRIKKKFDRIKTQIKHIRLFD